MCDDGNRVSRDGCSDDCRSDETCGNDVLDDYLGETCDDGNTENGDLCQANCASPLCGDGVVDSTFNEACDEGDRNGEDPNAACRSNCQPQRCGDGIVDSESKEECDDGNLQRGDGCSDACRLEVCGNNSLDVKMEGASLVPIEECDDGSNNLSHDGCTNSCEREEARWVLDDGASPPSRWQHSAVYDAARGRVLIFAGGDPEVAFRNDLWEWDGRRWSQIRSVNGAPPVRNWQAASYDAQRRVMVVFGGTSGITMNDTWEWDGQRWTEKFSSPAPEPRFGSFMVFDSEHGVSLLFGGGRQDGSFIGDTWEWDGAAWNQLSPGGETPTPRHSHRMAYDPARGVVVLFGGFDGSQLSDTWEWNGTEWSNLTPADPADSPTPRSYANLTYDADNNRILLFGGIDGVVGLRADTWSWDGSVWTPLSPDDAPLSRRGHTLTYDVQRSRAVLFGGQRFPDDYRDDTWEWDGTTWEDQSPVPADLQARYGHAMTYDPGRGAVLLFGGTGAIDPYLADLWQWNGSWAELEPASGSPDPRSYPALTFATAWDRAVVFGGYDGAPLGDTWEWNGTAWSPETPEGLSPSARWLHAMAYDAVRQRVVLFGGTTGTAEDGPYLAETWEWNGTEWFDMTPSDPGDSPSGRVSHKMEFDPRLGQVLLYGGDDGSATLADEVWAWDGSTWTPVSADPISQWGHGMSFDASTGRLITFGGLGPNVDATSEFKDQTWSLALTTGPTPSRRAAAAMAHSATAARSILFGGFINSEGRTSETWTFQYVAGTSEACTTGLDGDGDDLIGCADPDCWARCSPLCPPSSTQLWPVDCDASLPRCGDGECNVFLEAGRLCPADCGTPPAVCGDFLCDGAETPLSCPGDCPP